MAIFITILLFLQGTYYLRGESNSSKAVGEWAGIIVVMGSLWKACDQNQSLSSPSLVGDPGGGREGVLPDLGLHLLLPRLLVVLRLSGGETSTLSQPRSDLFS